MTVSLPQNNDKLKQNLSTLEQETEILNSLISVAINRKVINKTKDFKTLTYKFENHSITVEQLADEISKGYSQVFCKLKNPCECKDCEKENRITIHRKSESFELSNMFALDIDSAKFVYGQDGNPEKDENGQKKTEKDEENYFSFADALADPFIQENALLLYHSYSSTDDWNKFRIIFKLPESVNNAEDYREIVSAFIKKYGGDEACKDACRVFYGNKGGVATVLGKVLSVDALMSVLKPFREFQKVEIEQAEKKLKNKKVYEFKDYQKEYNRFQKKYNSSGRLSPCDDYDQRGDVLGLLCSHEWAIAYQKGTTTYLTRPGKKSGVSASFNYIGPEYPANRFYLFTSSTLFKVKRAYTPYAVYAVLECGGDFKLAVKKLAELGYGEPPPAPLPQKISASKKNEHYFWYIMKSNKPSPDTGEYTYSLKIDLLKLLKFIEKSGFSPMFILDTNESIFIRIENNIVEEVTPHRIKEFVLKWIEKEVPWELPFDEENIPVSFKRPDLVKELISAEAVYFGTTKLQCIVSVKPTFHKDKRDFSYFYFLNGFVEISKNGFSLKPYSELDGAIWKKHIIQRDFSLIEEKGNFEEFFGNVCNNDDERIQALSTALGYLLHRFKDPSNAKAVILVDEKISENPEGGTGKSLISTAISKLRNVTKIDGKDFDFQNRFAFQDVGLDSELIVFDDIGAKFPFERLFHKITDGLETERKGQQRFKRSFQDSPKYLLTTNYTVQGDGGSAERRKVEYELYGFYSKDFSPRDDFGQIFFEEWDSKEWSRFDHFAFSCIKNFLKNGLKTYLHKNLSTRKIIQETSQEFFEFMDDFFYFIEGIESRTFNTSILDKQLSIPELLESYCLQDSTIAKRVEKGSFTQNKFTNWLKTYAKYTGLNVESGRKRENVGKGRYQWICFSK